MTEIKEERRGEGGREGEGRRRERGKRKTDDESTKMRE